MKFLLLHLASLLSIVRVPDPLPMSLYFSHLSHVSDRNYKLASFPCGPFRFAPSASPPHLCPFSVLWDDAFHQSHSFPIVCSAIQTRSIEIFHFNRATHLTLITFDSTLLFLSVKDCLVVCVSVCFRSMYNDEKWLFSVWPSLESFGPYLDFLSSMTWHQIRALLTLTHTSLLASATTPSFRFDRETSNNSPSLLSLRPWFTFSSSVSCFHFSCEDGTFFLKLPRTLTSCLFWYMMTASIESKHL